MRDDVRGEEAVRAQDNPDATDTAGPEADAERATVSAERAEAEAVEAETPRVLDDAADAGPVLDDAASHADDGIPQQLSNVDDERRPDAGLREVGIAPVAMAESPPVMWDESTVSDLRIRWDAIQMRFVDDPGTTAAAARALVTEAIEALKASLARHEQELAAGDSATEDTEELRQLVSRYRKIFESVARP